MESPFCGTTGMSSTLSKELNREEEHVRLGLLEHKLHDRRDVHYPWPVFVYRPGLAVYPGGGEGGRRGPLGVGGATPPPVDPRRPTELRPNVLIRTHEERPRDDVSHDLRHFHQLVLHTRHRNVSRGRRRHFHQLFRQLRLLERGTLQDRVLKNLGHFGSSALPPQSPPAATQEHGEAGRRAQYRPSAPRCAAADNRSGREPPSSGTLSLSSRLKYRVPGSWEVGSSGTRPCASPRTHPPALAVFCRRRAAWCVDSARAIATLRRSCRSHCLSRRCRLRMAAPVALSTSMINSVKAQRKITNTKCEQPA